MRRPGVRVPSPALGRGRLGLLGPGRGGRQLDDELRALARRSPRPRSGRRGGARARGRCRGRGPCRRCRGSCSGRAGRTSRRPGAARTAGMPRPSSVTAQRTQRSSRASRTVTGPPSGEYLTAFSTRLTSTWRSCCSSAATGGSRFGDLHREASRIPRAGGSAPTSTTFSVSRAASIVWMSSCSWPESRWLASSTSLTICASRSDSSATTSSSRAAHLLARGRGRRAAA